jgi:hypothetical protein
LSPRRTFRAALEGKVMSEVEELTGLIELIYESVETPESWQMTLKAISHFLSVKDVSDRIAQPLNQSV